MVTTNVIDEFSKKFQEPQWFSQIRKQGYQSIDLLDFPIITRSNYHQTFDVSGKNFHQWLGCEVAIKAEENLSQISVISFSEAFETHPQIIEAYYLKGLRKSHWDKLTAHHAAFVNQGFLIYVPKNYQGTETLHLKFNFSNGNNISMNPHVLIVLEEGARLNYVEELRGDILQSCQMNYLVEIYLKENAQLNYSAVDELPGGLASVIRRYSYLSHDSRIEWAMGTLNQDKTTYDYYSHLIGKGSSSMIQVIGIVDGQQEVDLNTKIINQGQYTDGQIIQRGVVLDQARLSMNAIGMIKKMAKEANSQQNSSLLILTEQGHGDANPILLIDEFEVQAGHAASVGQLNQDQLYYLMSRGMSRSEAERLVIRAFLGQVINLIPLDEVRQGLITAIERKLS